MKILLVNPPVSEPLGPYPAIAYLAGFLKTLGRDASLADASIELLLRLFTREGVSEIAAAVERRALDDASLAADPVLRGFLARGDHYARTVDTAVRCLQRHDRGAAARASRAGYFPPPLDPQGAWASATYFNLQRHDAELGGLTPAQRARVLASNAPLRFAFGSSGDLDEGLFLSAALIADIAAVIQRAIDPEFSVSRYAERLTAGAAEFAPIAARLNGTPNLLDRHIDAIGDALAAEHAPDLVGLSVPFAGCLYGALRLARRFRHHHPGVTIVMGGGWVNTELRQLSDPGIFDDIDAITLDDGERPLQCLIEWLEGCRAESQLKRTYRRIDGRVVFIDGATEPDVPMSASGTPTYRGLPLTRYLSYRQLSQRLWGQRWNKLTLAHGCYWKRCAFCDTALDYIGRYEPATVDLVIERIRAMVAETGDTGFHFVDEAMPPALLARLARRLIDEEISIAWWGNVRFDAALAEMAPLLAESGCVGLTGGLEVASDRVLTLMAKGISLEQTARVCHALSSAGIYTHAYLIYGFPTQTNQETVDALEYIRQMFASECLRSAVWHEFGLTAFSPIAANPAAFGIVIRPTPTRPFTNYLLDYDEPGAARHPELGAALARALEHYRMGTGIDRPVAQWFAEAGADVPAPTLAPDFVRRIITTR